jgi:hypothetical protein
MGSLVHKDLGSSSLVAHVLPYHPPPHVNSFVLGPTVINTHTKPSPHRPRLVVSRSTCPPIYPPPHVNSFVLGPAVINTHTHQAAPFSNPAGGADSDSEGMTVARGLKKFFQADAAVTPPGRGLSLGLGVGVVTRSDVTCLPPRGGFTFAVCLC